MAPVEMDDQQLAIVARVARREGWTDPADAPAVHSPRTLDEERAVAAFVACGIRAPAPAPRAPWTAEARLRLAMAIAALALLGVCWWVSPARTALGLLGVGAVCLIAMRRRRRAAGTGAGAGAGRPRPWAWDLRRPG